MGDFLELEIVSPVKTVYKGKVKYVTAPGVMGQFQVLYNHAAMVAALQIGILRFEDKDGKLHKFSTSGGILEVKDNVISVLCDAIESPEDLDVERAKRSLERARRRLDGLEGKIDRERAMLSLLRAKNRLKLLE
ncbi:MAG: ATP synthase F1 subunit epsilon [Ignavibacteria bacterium]